MKKSGIFRVRTGFGLKPKNWPIFFKLSGISNGNIGRRIRESCKNFRYVFKIPVKTGKPVRTQGIVLTLIRYQFDTDK